MPEPGQGPAVGSATFNNLTFSNNVQNIRNTTNTVTSPVVAISANNDPGLDARLPEYAVAKLREEVEMARGLCPELDIEAYREGNLPFPEGTIIARLAWSLDASEENNQTFGRPQSFVAGSPKNGVQFMVKDSKKYAATDGWGYAQFDEGKPADDEVLKSCHPCHRAIEARDFGFSRYAR